MIVDLLVAPGQRPAIRLRILWIILQAAVSAFRSRRNLVLENLALRQQRATFKSRGKQARIRSADRAFWLVLHRL